MFVLPDEINLHIDSTQRELKKVVGTKQSLMVDENITKLEVKRLRDGLFSHADEVQSLEKRKLQLDTVSGMSKTKNVPFFTMIMLLVYCRQCQRETVRYLYTRTCSRLRSRAVSQKDRLSSKEPVIESISC